MAEESEGLDFGAEASAAGVDPAAMALALGGASREKADAFLDDQRRLIDDQRHHLHEQFKQLAEQLKQLRLGTWEKRLGIFLRIATALMGLLVAAGIAFMIWDASQSSRLLIEPFSVPSDLAARGMTGEVVAAKLLDRMMAIGLADARLFAGQCRGLVGRRIDPIEERRRRQQHAALEAVTAVTFKQCALSVIQAKRPAWRSKKHAAEWLTTLSTYAFPIFGHLPVGAVNTSLVLKALKPIWNEKNSTAGRVRERIEAVLDSAKAEGLRSGENPARWKGHLEYNLARPSKVQPVKHHAALPYTEIAPFMAELRIHDHMAARAMELLILTATRTSEALGMRWDEIDLEAGRWTIPAARIKTGKTHQIPLSEPALALLRQLRALRVGEFVFPGQRAGKPLSNMALLKVLERMGRRYTITTHGFRSTFRDWAAEKTGYPREVVEMALAHAIENKVEAAYRRGDLFEKRRHLMHDWAMHCEGKLIESKVVQLALAG